METLKDILWPVVVVGSLGAFIGFLLGKAGQEKARDFLLRWWVRFDDVRWNNFGREEGLFAGRLIEQWFGQRMWSFRRIASAIVLCIVFSVAGYLKDALSEDTIPSCLWCDGSWYTALLVVLSFLGFSISISLTKFVTVHAATLCRIGGAGNILIFLAMVSINYLVLAIWLPLALDLKETILAYGGNFIYGGDAIFKDMNSILSGFKDSLITTVTTLYPTDIIHLIKGRGGGIDMFTFRALASFSPLFRFLLAIVFVGSFLLRPLLMRPVNVVWRRIVESERPVFTVIFGGAAAFATALGEVAKHL